MMKNKTLRLILGDQLNINHTWYKTVDSSFSYVLMELRSETDYAQHHIQKVLGFFSAMRNFADELKNLNHFLVHDCRLRCNNARCDLMRQVFL